MTSPQNRFIDLLEQRLSSVSCSNCFFFVPDPDNNEVGSCHRAPPSVVIDEEGPLSIFPMVYSDAFCGEFFRQTNG